MTTLAGKKLTSTTGYGLMGLTWRPQPPSQEQSFKAMKQALASGANFWNGGEIYGSPERNSLHLLNEYFTKYPEDADKVILSIKGGGADGTAHTLLKPGSGSAENVRRSIQKCLDVLGGTKKLDIWESARVDKTTPIEVTMRAAKEFVDAGKLGGICLSEASAATIRRAAKIVPIVGVEVEVSLWATEIWENGVASTCAELGIPIIGYSPLGRGFLTGDIKKPEDIAEDDPRKGYPRFQPGAFEKNLELVHAVEEIGKKKEAKPGQVGLAWVKAKSGRGGNPVIIPIPGATTEARIKENMVDVHLTDEEVKEIDDLLERVGVHGDRYPSYLQSASFGDTPEE